MIFGLLYFCVVILCVNRSRTSFILYRIVKRHSRQSNVRRIWTCADNGMLTGYNFGAAPDPEMLHRIYNAEPVAPIIEIPRLD